ncbi:MAG: phytanoyl-CoA dioxygenase family protein [Acidimicrobiia bacterium]|nr:phytanoyl-CoA dioxygenase family protein [Acidimicrobiia bacterium]
MTTARAIAEARAGWHSSVPPNGLANRPREAYGDNTNVLGLDTPEPDIEIETTPEHRNLVAGDPMCAGWTRAFDDPNVVALRERLGRENGIEGLEIVAPSEVSRAAELFHRDGFVVVAEALSVDELSDIRAATDRVIDALVEIDPTCAVGGGAGGLPHRYSFGATSASRHRLHERAWTALIDLPTTTPILTEIFGSANYVVGGGGGDLAMPGAIEYQGLHADNIWAEPHDPSGRVKIRDLPAPVVTINFPTVDLTTENGPIRQIPGSQQWHDPIPNLADEPDWMKTSTLCPVPARSAIIRDNRAWHGGTPNLSREVRALPNIEYFAPWFRSEGIIRSMPYERWKELSDHGRRVSRLVMCGPGEIVIGAGFTHPRARARDGFVADQLEAIGPDAAAEYLQRR